MLGRLLLDRGQAGPAGRAFEEAVASGESSPNPLLAHEARVWLAVARIDHDRLTEAEAILRAASLAQLRVPGSLKVWSDAMLARCLLAQARNVEAADVLSSMSIEPRDTAVDAAIDDAADDAVDAPIDRKSVV